MFSIRMVMVMMVVVIQVMSNDYGNNSDGDDDDDTELSPVCDGQIYEIYLYGFRWIWVQI